MTPEQKQRLRQLAQGDLNNAIDNLSRFKSAAGRTDPLKEWGQSGRTLQAFIDENQEWADEAKKLVGEL